jgi:hypothetical protein
MLIPSNDDYSEAMKRLEVVGFRRTPWSYATIDPKILPQDPITQRVHASAIKGYAMLDAHSVRYVFPDANFDGGKVVLLQSDYVHLRPPLDDAAAINNGLFHTRSDFYWPNKILLLESFIRTLLQDGPSMWELTLTCWAITYVYGTLEVEANALDNCGDENVIAWFNNIIKRGQGGLDKTCTKRAR